MHTAHSLTVSRSICHACRLPCMPPSAMHNPPAMHAPLPHMPPCHTHLPATHTPCHAPPATHARLPCMPPAMHAPHHTCPPTMHTPCHTCPLLCMPPCHTLPLPHMPPLQQQQQQVFGRNSGLAPPVWELLDTPLTLSKAVSDLNRTFLTFHGVFGKCWQSIGFGPHFPVVFGKNFAKQWVFSEEILDSLLDIVWFVFVLNLADFFVKMRL